MYIWEIEELLKLELTPATIDKYILHRYENLPMYQLLYMLKSASQILTPKPDYTVMSKSYEEGLIPNIISFSGIAVGKPFKYRSSINSVWWLMDNLKDLHDRDEIKNGECSE